MLESKRLPYETSVSNPAFVKYYDQLDAYSRRFYYEFSIAYNRSFGDHNVSALALVNRQIFDSKDGGDIRFPNYNEDWVGRATYNWFGEVRTWTSVRFVPFFLIRMAVI